jgi:hypothetical protein
MADLAIATLPCALHRSVEGTAMRTRAKVFTATTAAAVAAGALDYTGA